ncbi:MAG: hypothetical protein AAFP76_09060 [Bacteroidota bacterium]
MKKTKETSRSFGFALVALVAAGLYPLIHYYNGNLEMADSGIQLLFLVSVCLALPLLMGGVGWLITRKAPLRRWSKYMVPMVNLGVFSWLISMLVFLSNRKIMLLVFILGAVLGLLLYRQIKRIVGIQLLLALMAVVSFIPRANFAWKHNNNWMKSTASTDDIQFKKFPNVYIIQPDGYSSFETLKQPPYERSEESFKTWLESKSFVNYHNFRSNYYSTLTSNSSLFAMEHHYYGNTYKRNLKTFDSQRIIAGDNPVISAFKDNGYTTHLLTDNSYFLINRKMTHYDYCNIPEAMLSFYRPGRVRGVDMVSDFKNLMEQQSEGPHFYFIEKTIPGHIAHGRSQSLGVEAERERYLDRLTLSEEWMKTLLETIYKQDDDPLIVLVADHGGYVGLRYVREVLEKELTPIELNSVFSSLLSIRWPQNEAPAQWNPESSVNLFRYVLSYLSEDETLKQNKVSNASFLPYDDGNGVEYYECLDTEGNKVFRKL